MNFLNNLFETLDLLDFPSQARSSVLNGAHKLCESKKFMELLNCSYSEYCKNGTTDYAESAKRAGELSAESGIPLEIGQLLFFLNLCPAAHDFYRADGRDDALFYATFRDLTVKSIECHKVRGIWGDMTMWYGRFFDRTRFMLGRLQFEECTLAYDYRSFSSGDKAINIHIPECGPLFHDKCLESYCMAVKEFSDCSKDNKTVFVCSSWLLASELTTFLPPTSNVTRFAKDFDILHVRTEPGFPDGWRVFGSEWKNPPEKLPRSTSMQRGYADYLLTHTHTTVPYGAFLFDTAKEIII